MDTCDACGGPLPEAAEAALCLECLSGIGVSEEVAEHTELHPGRGGEELEGPRVPGISRILRTVDVRAED